MLTPGPNEFAVLQMQPVVKKAKQGRFTGALLFTHINMSFSNGKILPCHYHMMKYPALTLLQNYKTTRSFLTTVEFVIQELHRHWLNDSRLQAFTLLSLLEIFKQRLKDIDDECQTHILKQETHTGLAYHLQAV